MGASTVSEIAIRIAVEEDLATVSSVLREAAGWIESRGEPLWAMDDLQVERLRRECEAGARYWIARVDGVPAGCLRFQLEDPVHWPDAPSGDAAYIHRVAVRRAFAGGRVSGALLDWAKSCTRGLGRRYLRLDCDARRDSLCRLYERNGFMRHSERQVGPYRIVRYEFSVETALETASDDRRVE